MSGVYGNGIVKLHSKDLEIFFYYFIFLFSQLQVEIYPRDIEIKIQFPAHQLIPSALLYYFILIHIFFFNFYLFHFKFARGKEKKLYFPRLLLYLCFIYKLILRDIVLSYIFI